MPETLSLAKTLWACRRGMKELDLMLIPFVENHFTQLTMEQQRSFVRLLESSDPQLYAWLLGLDQCDQPDLNTMITLIRHKIVQTLL